MTAAIVAGRHRRLWAWAAVEVQERLDGSRAVSRRGECLMTTPARAADAPVPVAPRPTLRRERAMQQISETKPG
ncbi:MAG: hypothetical protein M3Y58_14070 [Chloroflexota bacterium]|nr:hypothetical protein [Chloroflexota bacterium]